MYAQQCVQPTGTNRPRAWELLVLAMERSGRQCAVRARQSVDWWAGGRTISGGHGGGETPVPIPNTAVKPASADGTWGVAPWESRTPPDFLETRPPRSAGALSRSGSWWLLRRGRPVANLGVWSVRSSCGSGGAGAPKTSSLTGRGGGAVRARDDPAAGAGEVRPLACGKARPARPSPNVGTRVEARVGVKGCSGGGRDRSPGCAGSGPVGWGCRSGPVALLEAKGEVSEGSGADGEPVGCEAVGERGEQGATGRNAGEGEQPGESCFDETEPAGGDGNEPDDTGDGEDDEDDGGISRGPGCSERGIEAQQVEGEATGGEQDGFPQVGAEDGADLVALVDEPVAEVERRWVMRT